MTIQERWTLRVRAELDLVDWWRPTRSRRCAASWISASTSNTQSRRLKEARKKQTTIQVKK